VFPHVVRIRASEPPGNLTALRERLAAIHSDFADFEVEELVLYGGVKERLEQAGFNATGTDLRRRGVNPVLDSSVPEPFV